MKKILLTLLLILCSYGTINCQKSYLYIYAWDLSEGDGNYIRLSGDVPSNVLKYYSRGTYATTPKMFIGDLLNILAEEGFTIEQMSSGGQNANIILSRNASQGQDNIQSITIDDEEVREIARYNLQGLPVTANEKGIQIIVYSNYTTKTLIVE